MSESTLTPDEQKVALESVDRIDVLDEDIIEALHRKLAGLDVMVFAIRETEPADFVFAEGVIPSEGFDTTDVIVTLGVRDLLTADGQVVDRVEKEVQIDGDVVVLDAAVNRA